MIIINDGSTDTSELIVKKFIENYDLSDKVKLINKKNGGVNSAINLGLKRLFDNRTVLNNDLVSLCDSDDIWQKNKLSTQIKYMNENPSCDLSFHDLTVIGENNELIRNSFYHNNLSWLIVDIYNTSFFELFLCNHIISTTMIFRAKDLSLIYPFPEGYGLYQDYRIVLIYSLISKKIDFIDIKLGAYRQREGSLMNNASKVGLEKGFEGRKKQMLHLAKKFPDTDFSYYLSYYDDRIKRYKKGYGRVKFYLITMLKYPRIFFFLLKNILLYFKNSLIYKLK